ncbi:BON domain-containing protein [Legionella sp. km772]|uniref:BON domain-containing protein n=1 Tax=Legionella sp. km772 TaxID=2498111 RepID=UPI000F8E2FAC|nr:BON domain-containing protein [Legionella sp. km772]RUR10419.1 BON domain-containing protein [Legionella sp. km772]
MLRQGCLLIIFSILTACLGGCISNLWTGANLVYDRHDVYKKLDDYHLLVEVNNSLYADKLLKCEVCVLDVAIFNGDVLVAGHLPSPRLIKETRRRLFRVGGYRHLFIELKLSQANSNSLQDAWITTKIRSQIFADDSIDPNAFKIVTADQVVYLMGDVRLDEANKVINIARNTSGVVRVVKLLKYFTYQTGDQLAKNKVAR